MFKVEHNVITGEITEIALSAKEVQELESTRALAQAAATERLAAVEEKAAQKAALLERLGITEEEAQLLLGGN